MANGVESLPLDKSKNTAKVRFFDALSLAATLQNSISANPVPTPHCEEC